MRLAGTLLTKEFDTEHFALEVALEVPTNSIRGWWIGHVYEDPAAKRCGSMKKYRPDIRLERLQNGVVVKTYSPVKLGGFVATFQGEPSGEGAYSYTWDPASTYRVVLGERTFRGLYLKRVKKGKPTKRYYKAPRLICSALTLDLGAPG